MGDGRDHPCSILDEPAQPALHSIESLYDSLYLARPTGRHGHRCARDTGALDRLCQRRERRDKPPRDEDGHKDPEQYCRSQPCREAGLGETRRHRVDR